MVFLAKHAVLFPAVRVNTLRCGKAPLTVRTLVKAFLKMQKRRVRVKRESIVAQQVKNISMPLLHLMDHEVLKEVTLARSSHSRSPSASILLPNLNELGQVCRKESRVSNRFNTIEPSEVVLQASHPREGVLCCFRMCHELVECRTMVKKPLGIQ